MNTPSTAASTSVLLNSLKIERPAVARTPTGSHYLFLTSVVIAIFSVLVGTWLWHKDSATTQTTSLNSNEDSIDAVARAVPNRSISTSDSALAGSILDATGYVVARQSATVSSKTTGKVIAVFIEEGMTVRKGDLIARLDDSAVQARLDLAAAELSASRAAARELEARIRGQRLEVQRADTLAQRQLVSQSSFDALDAELDTLLAESDTANHLISVSERQLGIQRVALADLHIRAPFAGVVIKKSAQAGEIISPISAGGGFTRTGIGTIVDMASLEVEVEVSEAYINRVRQDQRVHILLNAYPESTYEGRVLAIIPTADRNKATIRVRVQFLSLDQRVLPEMGVRVAFLEG